LDTTALAADLDATEAHGLAKHVVDVMDPTASRSGR